MIMGIDRRQFFVVSAKGIGLIALPASLSQLTGCSLKNPLTAPYITIEEASCTGCGKCTELCPGEAIILPSRSHFEIDAPQCTGCGECSSICPVQAVSGVPNQYSINLKNCIGCGDCVQICENDAIMLYPEHYSVNNQCDRCGECVSVCSYGAITFSNRKARINESLCQRCGECLTVCPKNAIQSPKAFIDVDQCIGCGECKAVCENDAVDGHRGIPSFDLDVPLGYQYVGGLMGEKHPREKIHPDQECVFP